MNSLADTTLSTEAGADDAIFVTSGAQVDHLHRVAQSGFERAKLLPLSLHAYGAALTVAHPRIFDYRPLIDFDACVNDYRHTLLDLSQTWLRDMGLRCEVDGIDLAELDAPAQFLFFLHVQHIARLAVRIVTENRDVRQFYVISSDPLVPLDFYFDSDITAAVVRYVCDRLNRPLRTIIASPRPQYMPAPLPIDMPRGLSGTQVFPRTERTRIGLVTATVRNVQAYLGAFKELRFETVLIGSEVWGMSPEDLVSGMGLSQPMVFSSQREDVDPGMSEKLSDLRRNIAEKLRTSGLPASIRDNTYLDFQFDHIVEKRWLGYARVIRQAAAFVKQCPLDLLICSDHFTAEGAILSHLYRRTGTPIMTVPHSSWPVDANWRSPRHVDFALVWSKGAARRLETLDPRARIQVTGVPEAGQNLFRRIYPSGDGRSDTLDAIREAIGGRKTVLLLSNAQEIHAVPITSAVDYFDACAELANIPATLRDRVAVLVRPKPGAFGENPLLYEAFSGFPANSLVALTSISFDDCVRLADCVVGINVPTSGYWDVLRDQIPLIHLQTSAALALHPDLPDDITGGLTRGGQLWDAIAAALFDESHRRRLIERQHAFFVAEHQAERASRADALQDALLTACRTPFRRGLAGLLDRWRSISRRGFSADTGAWSDGSDRGLPNRNVSLSVGDLKLAQTGTAGHVDEVKISSDGQTVLVGGWAASLALGQPAMRIHAFIDGMHRGAGQTGVDRPDVAVATNEEGIAKCGFWLGFAAAPVFELSKLTVYGELSDGTFFALAPSDFGNV